MAYIKTVKYRGQKSTSTLNGDIRLEEGRGRLVVYNTATGIETTVVDIEGFKLNDIDGDELARFDNTGVHINDTNGNELTRLDNSGVHVNDDAGNELTTLDQSGLTTTESSGIRRIRIGVSPDDGRAGIWTSKPTIDVVDELT